MCCPPLASPIAPQQASGLGWPSTLQSTVKSDTSKPANGHSIRNPMAWVSSPGAAAEAFSGVIGMTERVHSNIHAGNGHQLSILKAVVVIRNGGGDCARLGERRNANCRIWNARTVEGVCLAPRSFYAISSQSDPDFPELRT